MNYSLKQLVESDDNELRKRGGFKLNLPWVFVLLSGLFYALIFYTGHWLAGKQIREAVDARIEERLGTYENYMIARERTRDEITNRHAAMIDSLFTECDVNRACWVSLAKRINDEEK